MIKSLLLAVVVRRPTHLGCSPMCLECRCILTCSRNWAWPVYKVQKLRRLTRLPAGCSGSLHPSMSLPATYAARLEAEPVATSEALNAFIDPTATWHLQPRRRLRHGAVRHCC